MGGGEVGSFTLVYVLSPHAPLPTPHKVLFKVNVMYVVTFMQVTRLRRVMSPSPQPSLDRNVMCYMYVVEGEHLVLLVLSRLRVLYVLCASLHRE